jgi:peptidoglycan/LPS O-acetylase OafA/YrhL
MRIHIPHLFASLPGAVRSALSISLRPEQRTPRSIGRQSSLEYESSGKRDANMTNRTAAFDGLRAIAVFGVLVQHGFAGDANHFLWSPGAAGVRLFFVLSGFLITRILAQARADAELTGTPLLAVWRAFIMRRAIRIFPVAYLAMAIAWMLPTAMREHPWWHLLFLGNIKMGLTGQAHWGIQHLWSLAVEEQFYVLWPIVMLFLSRRTWRPLFTSLIVTAFVLRIITILSCGLWGAYVLPWSRMDALVIGGLLAVWRPRHILAVLPVVSLLIAGGTLVVQIPAVQISLLETIGILMSAWIVLAVFSGLFTQLLTWRPLTYIGTISYGIYVWNALVPYIIRFIETKVHVDLAFPQEYGWMRLVLLSAWTVALASASWFLVEKPLNRFKRLFPYVRDSDMPPDPARSRADVISIAHRTTDPQLIEV